MKKPIAILIFCAAIAGSNSSYAQKPVVEQRTVQSGAGVQSAPREVKHEDKREELSKKLLQRKNEIRREEHDNAKEKRSVDVNQKSPEAKKN